MENISLESLDLKQRKEQFCGEPDFSAKMSSEEKRRYRNKLLFVWGIPVMCGVFSFLYWFVLVPLVWSSLPYQQWPVLWFSVYGVVAFAIWLAIMALALLWWRHKYNTIVKGSKHTDQSFLTYTSSKDSSNDSGFKDSPPFPTKVSAVQPLADTPNSSMKGHRGSSICIPVQGDHTPSLYNSRTGRESYEAGYQLEPEPATSSASERTLQELNKQNSGVLLLKKMNSFSQDGNKKKRISSSGSEASHSDFKKISRDSGDGLEKGEDNEAVESPKKKNLPAPLSREESFKGLPEMNSFGEYLQLVTIETPMSPREEFFSDLMVDKAPEVQMRTPRDRKSCFVGDLAATQQRITEARKSMPLFLYSSDIEFGLNEQPPPVTPPPSVLEIVHESPTEKTPKQTDPEEKSDYSNSPSENTVSPVTTTVTSDKSVHTSSGSKSSGKYFIADVLRTESITSEVHLNIEGESQRTQSMKRWETNISGSLSPQDDDEGKWVVLSRDYAANNLEAFIRVESEAMARERAEGIPHDDDADNDSVFMETDQC